MKSILLFTIIFAIHTRGFSQNGVVYYSKEIAYSAKITNSKGLTKGMNKIMKKVKEVSKKLNYVLKFNSKGSFFELEKKMSLDDYSRVNILAENLGGKGEYYTDIKQKIIVNRKDFYGDLLNIKKDFVDLSQWQLTSEMKKIGKYNCYKAVYSKKEDREKNVIIWYTPEIPYNYGPIEYAGFPGLVLSVDFLTKKGSDFLKFTYTATKIYLKKDKIKIPDYTKTKLITQEEYMKILKQNYLSIKKK